MKTCFSCSILNFVIPTTSGLNNSEDNHTDKLLWTPQDAISPVEKYFYYELRKCYYENAIVIAKNECKKFRISHLV